ncbi:hypothetical protein MMC26_007342 [Xylographa opegraphella]|nr:hypothetical protein [Xylographa opegraphella]
MAKEFDDDLLPWICISYVFKRAKMFQHVTKIAQLRSKGPMTESRLPIPEPVLSKINVSREKALTEIFSYVQSVLKSYQGGKEICPFSGRRCSAMILGSLTMELAAMGLLQPSKCPYIGFSYRTVTQHLSEIKILQLCGLPSESKSAILGFNSGSIFAQSSVPAFRPDSASANNRPQPATVGTGHGSAATVGSGSGPLQAGPFPQKCRGVMDSILIQISRLEGQFDGLHLDPLQ